MRRTLTVLFLCAPFVLASDDTLEEASHPGVPAKNVTVINTNDTEQKLAPTPQSPQRTSQNRPGPPVANAFVGDVLNPPRSRDAIRADGSAHAYYYPPRMALPLPTCFHNPTGYACCNAQLNDLIVETYTELEARPKFHTCNLNAIANLIQQRAETHFNTTFETITGYEDFAQKIHFSGDLVCKVELGGKYMLAYGTVHDVDDKLDRSSLSKRDVRSGSEDELAPNHISRTHSVLI